jgi:hypothetical protein
MWVNPTPKFWDVVTRRNLNLKKKSFQSSLIRKAGNVWLSSCIACATVLAISYLIVFFLLVFNSHYSHIQFCFRLLLSFNSCFHQMFRPNVAIIRLYTHLQSCCTSDILVDITPRRHATNVVGVVQPYSSYTQHNVNTTVNIFITFFTAHSSSCTERIMILNTTF